MRIASLVFGLVGGVVGIAIMLLLLVLSSLGAVLDAGGWGEILTREIVGLALAALGIAGAALAPGRPGMGAALQLVTAVSGLVATGLFWIPSAGLFALGALTGALGWWRARST